MPEPEELGQELVPQAAPDPTLFKSDDPMVIMQQTTAVAEALKTFIAQQGLVSKISGRDYIVVEGWQMLGMMLNVTPGSVVTEKLDDGWSATCELHDRNGRVVGMGEAECLTTERTWKSRDDYARKSMAQTRAIGKAYRNTFGFIAKAAGFEATPAEEMPETMRETQRAQAAPAKPKPDPLLTPDQLADLLKKVEAAGMDIELILPSMGLEATDDITVSIGNKIMVEVRAKTAESGK